MAAIAAIGTVLSVAQTLFAALQNPQVVEFCSIWGYKSQLESLKDTVSTIKAVLLDAEEKQELSNEAQEWIKKLKDAVYDADDLLDEFTTLAEQHQLMEGGRVSKKVRLLISRFNQMGVAYTMSRGIKKIRKKLEGITSNHTQFGFTIDPQPIRRRREETCSYVFEDNVIGRENETREIIDMLLNSEVQRDISFLTIVGMGGLGKTTLAQLVYNHKSIVDAFPLRLWVCVGDHGQKHFNLEEIFGKILMTQHEKLGLEVLQKKLRDQLEGKKYLLVLDDLWNEDRNEYLRLTGFLMRGGRGSRIVVTTRSYEVATVVGDGLAYELHGLSDDNSWKLFKLTAFKEGQEQSSPDLVDIGKEIVKKCANVPLAIRVVGTLLYGQDRTRWLSFQKIGLADIRQGKNDIMSILKFSYYHLEPELKSCFSYCVLFPKDYVIEKEMLISLWMAQGCIVPLDQGQTIEDAGDEYFSILLRRCFFQGVQKDKYGEIVSCKIHDLMHDIAQEVAGKEMNVLSDSCVRALEKEIHHLSAASLGEYIFTKSKIRTYLRIFGSYLDTRKFPLDTLLEKWTCLRTLDLHRSGIESLPDTIGKLLHLRYLDLSWNLSLSTLPKSITRLRNLQTLKLRECGLRELPKDLTKLVKLRLLDISECRWLTYMPSGMDKLTSLAILPKYVAGEVNSSLKQCVSQVRDLKPLNDLKGGLEIQMCENYTYVKEGDRDRGYLLGKEHLIKLRIVWKGEEYGRRVDDEEALALLEELQPHSNLKELGLRWYCGGRLPSWGREDNLATFLPNLVCISLWRCVGLKYLSSLHKLRYLKFLELVYLESLEYIEDTSSSSSNAASSSRAAVESLFFPSLEELRLEHLPKLEGWWRDNQSIIRKPLLPLFPRLFYLTIKDCPRLTYNPPSIRRAHIRRAYFEIKTSSMRDHRSENPLPKPDEIELDEIEIGNIEFLKALPTKAFRGLSRMKICIEENLESLSEVKEVLRSCSSTLDDLQISGCPKLRGIFGELNHLTCLKSLVVQQAPSVDLNGEEGDGGGGGGCGGMMPWKPLQHTLRFLRLRGLPQLVNLPKGMQYLTSLRSLFIEDCDNLEALPPWIPCLTSLHFLSLIECPGIKSLPEEMRHVTSLKSLGISYCSPHLIERCQKPTGEDWPKIQHVPDVSIRSVWDHSEGMDFF